MRFKYYDIRVISASVLSTKEDAMLDKYGYIGERIRKERTKYDLSLSELAKEIGVSVSLLSLVENGKATPSMTVLDKICSFFSIHMASLFEEETGNPKVVLLKKDKQFEVKIDDARARRFLLPRTGVPIEPRPCDDRSRRALHRLFRPQGSRIRLCPGRRNNGGSRRRRIRDMRRGRFTYSTRHPSPTGC